MLQILPFTVRRISKIFIAALLLLMAANDVVAQPCGGNYPNPKANRRSITIPNTGGFYTGLLEYLPNNYASSPANTRYPVIIYFGGWVVQGDGSQSSLCTIITDQQSGVGAQLKSHLVDQIESGVWGTDNVPTVGGTSFIVIAPQYTGYGNGNDFTWSDQTDALIDWILQEYPKADPSRIYMTGMSTGSNLAMDYISSSVEHAQRVAAVSFATLCFPRNLSSSPNGAQNIAVGDVATWFVHCARENQANVPPIGSTNPVCVIESTNDWVNAINSNSPTTAPRYSILHGTPGPGTYPAGLDWCQGDAHNSWIALYNPLFPSLQAPGPSLYSWFLQFDQESALPIVLKNFSARLSNGKVYLRWITSAEQNNAGFVIERAGSNGSYSAITQVSGGGNTSGDKVYEYVDENPLPNLSYYRLKQMDLDGVGRYHEVRKVMNQGRFKSKIIVTPNPFTSDPSAFVSVDRKQHLNIFLTDMSGRILSRVNGIYEEGTTELSLPTSSLPRGVYFIRMQGDGIAETHKIIKQ
jgi:hypothetical protein